MTLNILIADDQALVRGAMAALLSLEDDINVLAELGRGDEVLPAVEQAQPDVALLDVEMPGLDGIEVAEQLHRAFPDVRVIIVTTFGRLGYLARALKAGVWGYVVKDTPATKLASIIRDVASGRRVIDSVLAVDALAAGSSPLSKRERGVLRVARRGATAAEIAHEVNLSEGTVRNYLSTAMGKLNASTRFEAAQIAEEQGWLD